MLAGVSRSLRHRCPRWCQVEPGPLSLWAEPPGLSCRSPCGPRACRGRLQGTDQRRRPDRLPRSGLTARAREWPTKYTTSVVFLLDHAAMDANLILILLPCLPPGQMAGSPVAGSSAPAALPAGALSSVGAGVASQRDADVGASPDDLEAVQGEPALWTRASGTLQGRAGCQHGTEPALWRQIPGAPRRVKRSPLPRAVFEHPEAFAEAQGIGRRLRTMSPRLGTREASMASVVMVRCKNPGCGRLFQSLLQFDPPSFAGAVFAPCSYRCPRCHQTNAYSRDDHLLMDYQQKRSA